MFVSIHAANFLIFLEIDLPENRKTLTDTIYTSKKERDIPYLIETDNWLNPELSDALIKSGNQPSSYSC